MTQDRQKPVFRSGRGFCFPSSRLCGVESGTKLVLVLLHGLIELFPLGNIAGHSAHPRWPVEIIAERSASKCDPTHRAVRVKNRELDVVGHSIPD